MMSTTNQGTPTIEQALDIVAMDDLKTVAAALWKEAESHRSFEQVDPAWRASCECLAIEAVAQLLHMGYQIAPPTLPPENDDLSYLRGQVTSVLLMHLPALDFVQSVPVEGWTDLRIAGTDRTVRLTLRELR